MPALVDPNNYEELKPKLSSAIIIGHTTHNCSKIWARVYKPGVWWLALSNAPFKGDMQKLEGKEVLDFFASNNIVLDFIGSHEFLKGDSQTFTFEVTNLRPETKYYYALIADQKEGIDRRTEIGTTEKRWFRTLKENPSDITFGFYSCHDPFSNRGHGEGMWPHFYETLKEKKADFAIGGGDQVYVDTNKTQDMQDIWTWLKKNKDALIEKYTVNGQLNKMEVENYLVALYRVYYRIYWNQLNLLKVFGRFPQYMIWDDHEIMDGWGSLSWEERSKQLNQLLKPDDENANKELVEIMFKAASKVYDEYQHAHNPSTNDEIDASDGIPVRDYGFTHGQYAFYVMDMRGHHDVESPYCRLLGRGQHTRISDWLSTPAVRAARSLFIVSPVPVVHWGEGITNLLDHGGAKDDLKDEWGHDSNHVERKLLLDKFFSASEQNSQPVVFLSGDVHSASVFKLYNPRFNGACLISVTSSGISRKPAPDFSKLIIQKGGELTGSDAMCDLLYSLTGLNNCACFTASIEDGTLEISVSLYWPGGDDLEIAHKKIILV